MTLDLTHNDFSNQGIQYIANALQKNKVRQLFLHLLSIKGPNWSSHLPI
jgi:hypothetical protein